MKWAEVNPSRVLFEEYKEVPALEGQCLADRN
jgi:hypothetical protein